MQELFQTGGNPDGEGSELQWQKNNSLPSVYTVSTPATGEKISVCKWLILWGRVGGEPTARRLRGTGDLRIPLFPLLRHVELQPAGAFAAARLFAPADPQMGRAVDPSGVLIGTCDPGSFARHLFFLQ